MKDGLRKESMPGKCIVEGVHAREMYCGRSPCQGNVLWKESMPGKCIVEGAHAREIYCRRSPCQGNVKDGLRKEPMPVGAKAERKTIV